MTVRKHFKQIVRERMKKTGESYTSARRQLIKDPPAKPVDPRLQHHYPGNIPGATALRVLLSKAGINNPGTSEPFSEAMAFGIAGGIGIGVASFRYEKEDFSSFFISGRHLWFDDVEYLTRALSRFGIEPTVQESGSAKAAEKQLRETIEAGPCVAWVDMAHLPHRALPEVYRGGGYHIVTIYKIEDDHAIIGDLTDEPVRISMTNLASARARITKQKHRLLSIPSVGKCPPLESLVHEGLRVCHQSLTAKPGKGPLAMSSIDSLKKWADRLQSTKEKESWDKHFLPGANLWRGLTSIHQFIEMYGTGGGLSRPMMADFLNESAELLKEKRLQQLADQYSNLGRGWSELARSALPESVATLREARELQNRYAELLTSNASIEEKQQVWTRLDELAKEASAKFPLTDKASADLRRELQASLRKLIDLEESALRDIAEFVK